jgi:heterodisulfide reductase subunit A2
LNIELLTLAELENISGSEGNFKVNVRLKPRIVDMEKCIACNLCAEKCPKKVPDEYNEGLVPRKSAYIKYGQTVPLKYAIEKETCIFFVKGGNKGEKGKGKCRACEKYCPTGAIDLDQDFQDEIREVSVGSIILTPGFKSFDPSVFDTYQYSNFKDVVTGLEYERLLSSNGPCMGHLVRPSDDKEPKKIAWLQCVGSRNINKCDNGYCSSVCCMYAIKQAIVTAEHTTGDIEQTIFYMDIRTHGKEFDKYYELAKEKGIKFVPSRIHSTTPGDDGGVEVEYFNEETGQRVVEGYDMLVLSTGLEVSKSVQELAAKLDIKLDKYNFADSSSFAPSATNIPGIFASGCFQSPKDIPQSVTDASAAAASASIALSSQRGTLAKERTFPPEKDVAAEEPRVGVFVCSCGINIAGTIDVKELSEYAKGLPNVVFVDNNLFSCSQDTQVMIKEKITEHNLNRVVVAACTPRTHEPLFRETMKDAGLNEYLFEMANIRNQNSWVHSKEPEQALSKAKDQVRMAVVKASMLTPLEHLSVNVNQSALVVGGGISGMIAALGLADQGYETILLEKTDKLGGNAWSLSTTWRGEEIKPFLEDLISRVENNPNIKLYKNAQLKTSKGAVGDFVSEVEIEGEKRAIKYGIAVVCTGGQELKPNEYLYGEDERVFTHLEFDKELVDHKPALEKAKGAVFIQCVGSREPERPYCSRVCCTHTVHSALELKKAKPEMPVYVLYRDIRTYGSREDLYRDAREKGVVFVRYNLDNKPKVTKDGDDLVVTVKDHVLQRDLEIRPGYLVLASAILPSDNKDLVSLYKCGLNSDGFLQEAHAKLRPVDLNVDGMFLAGLCHYPKPVDEAIAQAQAAVSRATTILSRAVMPLDSIKSFVTENCDGCAICVDTCPYGAISLVEYEDAGVAHKKIDTNNALCKGCGICEATCPKQGVYVHGFTNEQLRAQIYAVLENV